MEIFSLVVHYSGQQASQRVYGPIIREVDFRDRWISDLLSDKAPPQPKPCAAVTQLVIDKWPATRPEQLNDDKSPPGADGVARHNPDYELISVMSALQSDTFSCSQALRPIAIKLAATLRPCRQDSRRLRRHSLLSRLKSLDSLVPIGRKAPQSGLGQLRCHHQDVPGWGP